MRICICMSTKYVFVHLPVYVFVYDFVKIYSVRGNILIREKRYHLFLEEHHLFLERNVMVENFAPRSTILKLDHCLAATQLANEIFLQIREGSKVVNFDEFFLCGFGPKICQI